MRVLITGANGFLGSHVAERLAADGAELRLALRKTANLEFLSALAPYDRVDYDMRDAESLRRVVDGVDAVAHVAGLTTALNESEYVTVNAEGTGMLAKAAADAGVKRFVYISSMAAQGAIPDGDLSKPVTPRPVSAYGRSKLAGEAPVLAEQDRMSVAIIRPPVIYGPRDRALLPVYKAARLGIVPVYGDGSNMISWIHASDCADAIARLTFEEVPNGAVYTVSDGQPHTWRGLIEAYGAATGRRPRVIAVPRPLYEALGYAVAYAVQGVCKLTGWRSHLSPKEIDHLRLKYWICDYAAIERDLGWQPKIGIVDGLRGTLAWYKAHRWL
jgi:nucleoside-diphosphate-sugar epimerase